MRNDHSWDCDGYSDNKLCTCLPMTTTWREKRAMNLFEEIHNKKAELDRMIQEFGEKAIKEYLQEFWDQNPEILEIMWHQYTPYFNDGDPCEFGVYDVRAKFVDTPGVEDEAEDDYYTEYEDVWDISWRLWPDVDHKVRQENVDNHKSASALKKLNAIWQSNESALRSVFGEHSQIKANREKITVEDYEHD